MYKILLAGIAVAIVGGGFVFYNTRPEVVAPPANLDTVTERAKSLQQNEQKPVVSTEATTSEAVVVTPAPDPVPPPVVQVAPEPVVATPVPEIPTPTPEPVTPVVTTPAPAPTPQPAPAPTGITKAEVSAHATESSCWSIINGSVYDLTDYASRHPGGKSRILGICGKDGTRSFEGQHGGSSKVARILSGYFIDNFAS